MSLAMAKQQLAKIFRLRGFLGNEIEASDLGKPLDELGDFVAE